MIRLFAQRNWRVGERAAADAGATPLERLRALFIAAGEVFKAPRPLFVSFVEAIAQAGRSDELREQLAAHYADARHAIAEGIGAMLAPAADHLQSDPRV